MVETGLERLIRHPLAQLSGQRLGLLCNPASVDRHLRHARHLIHRAFPGQLRALFSPQHGLFAEKQDNMVESAHLTDPELNLPAFSLYGETRIPTPDMFDGIDTLIIDLQDVGTRVYTFVYTMSHCMEMARDMGKAVVVLDRPNPLGGDHMEGNLLENAQASFVGRYPIPMRHGMTIGELARFFNAARGIGCRLEVVPMAHWQRHMGFPGTGLPWVAPSPNLPTPASALVYPGQVIWEGTNISEGRGTTQPFEIFGAPFLDTRAIGSEMENHALPGVILRPCVFEPTFNKWQGQQCHGFQVHVTDWDRFRPYHTALKLLQTILKHHRDDFQWKPPPYEYEHQRPAIDLILGSRKVRKRIEALNPLDEIEQSWQPELSAFRETARSFFLYR
ncbi:MAG: DUF1343 domain-containing protein [Desulfobacterales bacterium]|nr:DUF1343 domain-containing protein [Desulfobacterales bacterium]